MVVVISEHNYISGTDGTTVLGAIAGLGAILLVFLLYIKNKGWWWGPVRGMTCCDEACPKVSSRSVTTPPVPHSITAGSPKPKLVKAYSFDGGDSSSESEMGTSRSRQNSGVALINAVPYLPPRQDLISLVEKGRVGMSSNSSCCSSTTSSVGEKHGIPATKLPTDIISDTIQRYL